MKELDEPAVIDAVGVPCLLVGEPGKIEIHVSVEAENRHERHEQHNTAQPLNPKLGTRPEARAE